MSKAKPHPPVSVNKSPTTRPITVIKQHPQATVTHTEVGGDEVFSLDAGVELVVDLDLLSFIAQPSLITITSTETMLATQISVHVQG